MASTPASLLHQGSPAGSIAQSPFTPSGHAQLPRSQSQSYAAMPGPGTGLAAPSVSGSVGSSTATALDAPNEARRVIRALLETEGQGRLSLRRVATELAGLMSDIATAFTASSGQDSAGRLRDLLKSLDEIQVALARTGLGSLTAGTTDFSGIQPLVPTMANDVQTSFQARQRVREGAGVVKSIVK